MKFIRWLGAFGKSSSLAEAASWERSQVERQVAVEPLWRGRSFILHAKIGLEVDWRQSRFVSGWLCDAWTETADDGTLRSNADKRGKLVRYRDRDRFLAIWSRQKLGGFYGHAEAAFEEAHYSSVVVKKSASARGKRRAQRLAEQLGLPLKVMHMD